MTDAVADALANDQVIDITTTGRKSGEQRRIEIWFHRLDGRFYITGSATAGIPELAPADYARVVAYDFAMNWLQCEGSTVASSESLTHAAVYESDPTARAVIHCHDMKLWAALLGKAPTTPKRAEYGTPEMAYAVRRLFEATDIEKRKIFVMAAHDGGLVTFGKDLQDAFGILRPPIAG